jgi:hypothetical protein
MNNELAMPLLPHSSAAWTPDRVLKGFAESLEPKKEA